MIFPNALKATRKLSPRTAPLSPNTALKNKVATVVPELTRSYLVTAAFLIVRNIYSYSREQDKVNDRCALTCGKVCHVGKNIEDVDYEEG